MPKHMITYLGLEERTGSALSVLAPSLVNVTTSDLGAERPERGGRYETMIFAGSTAGTPVGNNGGYQERGEFPLPLHLAAVRLLRAAGYRVLNSEIE